MSNETNKKLTNEEDRRTGASDEARTRTARGPRAQRRLRKPWRRTKPRRPGDTSEEAGSGPPPRKLSFREHVAWLWGYWRPHKFVLVFLALFTLLSTTVAVAYPLVFRWVIDRVSGILASSEMDPQIKGVMTVLTLILLGHFVARLYPATRAMMNARLDRDMRDDVFGRLMEKDYHFNNTFRTGDVVTRLTDDIAEFPKIAWFGCSGIFRAVESSSKLIFCLAAMVVMSWKLTAVAVIPLPFMVWIFYSLRHSMRHYMEASQRSVSKTNNLLESAFSGIRIVKAFSAEQAQSGRLSEILRERVEVLVGLVKLQIVMFSLDTFASRLGQMIVIAYGGALVIGGELTIGTIFAFYVYLDMLTGPMMDVPFLFMTGQQAFVSIDRVEQIRAFPVKEPRPQGARLDEIHEVAFDGVSFSYDGSRNSVDRLDFQVPAGRKVAIVGPVASGKSTVLKLIAGILSPQEGEIRINGKPLTEWDWETTKNLIGYVPQEAVLFSKSIRDNVAFGREGSPGFAGPGVVEQAAVAGVKEGSGTPPALRGDAESRRSERQVTLAGDAARPSDAEIRAAQAWVRRCLSVSQMDSDLDMLPEGIDTVVGQKGGLVSGGQKQRIAIARALAGRPHVLLFDDCTAALDAQNEAGFWRDLDKELGSRICFIVSHRLSTIRHADTILVLDDGQLVDKGTHEDLLARCEGYREFLQTERRKEHLRMVSVT